MSKAYLYTCLTADPSEPPKRSDRTGYDRAPALSLSRGVVVDTDLDDGTTAAAEWWRRLAEVAAEIAAWHDQRAAERTTARGAR